LSIDGQYDARGRRFRYSSDGEPNKYSGYVYDAVWLYAIALGRLMIGLPFRFGL
jgi:hypothetical protein